MHVEKDLKPRLWRLGSVGPAQMNGVSSLIERLTINESWLQARVFTFGLISSRDWELPQLRGRFDCSLFGQLAEYQ